MDTPADLHENYRENWNWISESVVLKEVPQLEEASPVAVNVVHCKLQQYGLGQWPPGGRWNYRGGR
jgi:hypothetical protein